MFQCLNTALVFAALWRVLLWEGLEKPPAAGTRELLVKVPGNPAVPPLCAFQKASSPSREAVLRGGPGWLGARCQWDCMGWCWSTLSGLSRCQLPLAEPLPWICWGTERGPKLAQTKLCSHTGGNSRAVLWGHWIETTPSQHGSLVFVWKAVAI